MKTLSIVIATAAALASAGGTATAAPRQASEIPGSYIVVLRQGRDVRATEQELARDNGVRARHRFTRAVPGFSAELSSFQLDRVRRHPAVAFVSPDRPVRAASVPLSSGDSAPTGVRRIEAAAGSQVHEAGAPVAVIDSGIDLDHPDLRVAGAVDCTGSGSADDDNGHGTHVAGTIGALNDGRGLVGVAPGTPVHAVKVLDASGSGSWASIICGIDWVTGTMTDTDPTNDVLVANMSLGGSGPPVGTCASTTDALHLAICRSSAAGVTYVVAAGNSGWDFDYAPAPDVPAAYPEVLTVTAAADSDGLPGGAGGAPACDGRQVDDRAATFSNYAATATGAAHVVAAPGSCITSTWPGGGSDTISGTSMAAPHVAAVAALCIREGSQAGACAGMGPAGVISALRDAAARRTAADPSYGFAGDPTRPFSGRAYGHLAWSGVDQEAPTVTSTTPGDGATGVATSATVTVGFSEAMDRPATQSAFSLVADGASTATSGSFSWSGATMSFRPSSALAPGTWYTAGIGVGASDVAGNQAQTATTWRFRTVATITTTAAGVTIETGSLKGGSLPSLSADDNGYLQVGSTSKSTYTSSWYGRFTNVPRAPTSLTASYKGKSSRTCTQTISLYRWTTGSWVTLDTRSIGGTEVRVDAKPSGTLGEFVSGTGEVRARIRCVTSGGRFTTYADLLSLTTTSA